MARYLGSKCAICRREGEKLYLKGERCFSAKCSYDRRSYAPGHHGIRSGARKSDYAVHLREKQKIRRLYNMMEKPFRTLYKSAAKTKGNTGANLLQLLETRLDQVVYKIGFGASSTEARQLIKHNGILVNGERVNVPSYRVKVGDVIEPSPAAKEQLRVKTAFTNTTNRGIPEWINVDSAKMSGTIVNLPDRDQISSSLNEALVVELYSK